MAKKKGKSGNAKKPETKEEKEVDAKVIEEQDVVDNTSSNDSLVLPKQRVTSFGKRVTSGQFNQLRPSLVRELKEAFTLLDKDGDGTVSQIDLEEVMISIGQDPTPKQLDNMTSTMPAPLSFPSFLTGMSELMTEVSSSAELAQAFDAFKDSTGAIQVNDLHNALAENGMSESDITRSMKPFLVNKGFGKSEFDQTKFIELVVGDK